LILLKAKEYVTTLLTYQTLRTENNFNVFWS